MVITSSDEPAPFREPKKDCISDGKVVHAMFMCKSIVPVGNILAANDVIVPERFSPASTPSPVMVAVWVDVSNANLKMAGKVSGPTCSRNRSLLVL